MIDLNQEQSYYANEAANNTRIAAALLRSDVREALARIPDATGLSARISRAGAECPQDDTAIITAYVSVNDEPEIADIANRCDGLAYLLDMTQPVLDAPGVRVEAHISGRWKLTEEERETLRAIGKLQLETNTREYLACAA
jgi:hypothetical protein